MNKKMLSLLAVVALMMVLAIPAAAQTGTIKGKVIDDNGQPMVGATIQFINKDSGQKYELKTDKKGEYFSLGIVPGVYDANLMKDGKVIFPKSVRVTLSGDGGTGTTTLDFDLPKDRKEQKSSVTDEQRKAIEAKNAEAKKNNDVNDILQKADDAAKLGDIDTALNDYKQAAGMMPNIGFIHSKIGEMNMLNAKKATDATERNQLIETAIVEYQKAVDVTLASDKPKEKDNLGAYYNNLGDANAKTNHIPEAIDAFNKAAAARPADAGMFYYNLGAVLVNTNHLDEAVEAFDKCIAAKPDQAEAYYQKGAALVGKATYDKDGKVQPVPGTVEALNKYLELSPNGRNAASAKELLAYVGSQVTTKLNTKKKN